jgi:hypothetical protein
MQGYSHVRLLVAFAIIAIAEALIGLTFGSGAAGRSFPALLAILFGILMALGIVSDSIWFVERGGRGAYKISRKREPGSYWVTMGLYGVSCLAFAALYLR